MRFDHLQEPEAREPERDPEPQAPAEPHALLALQRTAGNAAVGRMIARTFAELDDASNVTWHKGTANRKKWEKTGATTRWLFWTYDVYRRKKKKPKAVQDTVQEPAAAAAVAADEPEEDLPDEVMTEQEMAAEAASGEGQVDTGEQSAEHEEEEDDGGGWNVVKSQAAAWNEAAQQADPDALAKAVDDHQGALVGVIAKFNRLFNVREAQGLDLEGTIVRSYKTRYDHDGGYSIELELPYLDRWIVHAHLMADGSVIADGNATHYKHKNDTHTLGVSVSLLEKQIKAILPGEGERASWAGRARRHAHLG